MNGSPIDPKIVGCVIVKDEQRFLADCLTSMRQFCDEIVVVDTGSRDRTPDIARAHADRVSSYPFSGNFSDARNHALDLVDGADWVLFLDADERIHPRQAEALRSTLGAADAGVGGISMLRYNFFPSGGFYSGNVLKLFRADPRIRYERRVNESVKGSLARAGYKVADSPALLTHIGHMRSRVERDRKAELYMRLMREQLAAAPDDAILTGYIGLNLRILGRFSEALDLSAQALAIDDGNATVWAFRGHVLRSTGETSEARQAYARALELRPSDGGMQNMIGCCEASAGRLDEADELFAAAFRTDPRLVHTVLNRGLVAQARGDFPTAEARLLEAAGLFPPLLTEDPVGRMETDPLHTLYFETMTGYAGLAHHLAYVRGCREGWLSPIRVSARAED
ncbi:glycosyltransferase [Micromonospora sp. DT62]|uniref:glycosyltransferase n=1 Tax=Micromonospora sp. DT62 TaxID=3416521 RepID=UPI003CE83C88